MYFRLVMFQRYFILVDKLRQYPWVVGGVRSSFFRQHLECGWVRKPFLQNFPLRYELLQAHTPTHTHIQDITPHSHPVTHFTTIHTHTLSREVWKHRSAWNEWILFCNIRGEGVGWMWWWRVAVVEGGVWGVFAKFLWERNVSVATTIFQL